MLQVYPISALNLTKEAQDRLIRFLERSAAGMMVDLRSPLYDRADRDVLLGQFDSAIGVTPHQELNTLDQREREKCGPFSLMPAFTERIEDVDRYFNQASVKVNNVAYNHALNRLLSIIPRASLRLASLGTAVESRPKHTNLGLPLFTNDEDEVGRYVDRADAIIRGQFVEMADPAVLAWRGQAAGRKATKSRVLFMMDHVDTYIGKMLQIPLLNALSGVDGFAAWEQILMLTWP